MKAEDSARVAIRKLKNWNKISSSRFVLVVPDHSDKTPRYLIMRVKPEK